MARTTSRAPASFTSESCLELMQGFYPGQSKDFLEKRIAANKDFHSFYRAFVPFYYDVINEDQEIKNTFLQLSKFKAAIGGDVHVENFGFVMTSSGSARLVLNDVDDVTFGPVYMDVMRLYISGKIVSDDVHWANYLAAYQAGLKGEDHVFSDYVKRNKQNAPVEIKKFLDEYISSDLPTRFIKFKKPMYVLDGVTKNEILSSFKDTNPKIKIFDEYLRVKEDGGSAGIMRYEVLAQIVPGEEPVWLDIKEMTVSSYDKVFKKDVPTFIQRMSMIKNSLYEEEISSHISMIKIGNKDFSVRMMNQFGLGVKIEDISNLELVDTVLDEAFALGQIHARSLLKNSQKIEDYSQAWEKIPNDEVKIATKKIREVLEKKYTSKI
jgi:hypothetical protein